MDYICIFTIMCLFLYIFVKDFARNFCFVAKKSCSTSTVQKRLIFADVSVYFLPSLKRV